MINMQMQNHQQEKPFDYLKEQGELMVGLCRELGIIGEFTTFDGSSEGEMRPGVCAESGKILTKEGKIYHYWLDWDPEKIAPDGTKGYYSLGDNRKSPRTGEPYPFFREATPEEYRKYQKHPEGYPEYIAAKKKLGLM